MVPPDTSSEVPLKDSDGFMSEAHGSPYVLSLHVLGTSSAKPTRGRSVSGSYLMTPGGAVLIDCGEGMQERISIHNRWLRRIGSEERTRLSRIRAVLLTHGHLDHCWGLLPMLHSMDQDGRTAPLTIHGPTSKAALRWVEEGHNEAPSLDSGIHPGDLAIQFDWWRRNGGKEGTFRFDVEWNLHPVDDIGLDGLEVLNLDGTKIHAFHTDHGIPSVAYRVRTPSIPGRFNIENARESGLDETSIRNIAKDSESDEHRGASRPERTLILSGDTTVNVPSFNESIGPVDILVHEATFDDAHEKKALDYGHSTARQAAQVGLEIGARLVALNHFSSRFQDLSHLGDEASEVHPNCHLLEDGDRLQIHRDGMIRVDRRTTDAWVPVLDLELE